MFANISPSSSLSLSITSSPTCTVTHVVENHWTWYETGWDWMKMTTSHDQWWLVPGVRQLPMPGPQAGELSTPTTWTLPGPGPMATTHYYVLVPTPFRCMNRIDSSHYVYYYHSPYKHKTYHTPHSHTNLSLLNDMVFTADRIKWKLHL